MKPKRKTPINGVFLTAEGRTLSQYAWAKRLGVNSCMIHERRHRVPRLTDAQIVSSLRRHREYPLRGCIDAEGRRMSRRRWADLIGCSTYLLWKTVERSPGISDEDLIAAVRARKEELDIRRRGK